MSLIATLREEARLPLRTIQWYLDTVHGLHLSRGAIVDAIRKVAGQAQGMVADILEQVRASPVVYADETGWREDGHNGYLWTFSTPDQRYFLRRGRGKAVVDEVLGNEFAGVLVSDFYAAYHHCRLPLLRRPQQRCWAHLLRDIHDLRARYPCEHATQMMDHWPSGLTPSTNSTARPRPLLSPQRNDATPPSWPWKDDCWPSAVSFQDDPSAVPARLCRRIENHIKELFVFVAQPEVPPDNNTAERSRRQVVVSRKVSGGTRSAQGTDTKMTLASIFGTWRAQGLNSLVACRQLIASPQL